MSSGKHNVTVWRPSVCLSRQHTHHNSPGSSTRRRQRTFRTDNKEDRHTCYNYLRVKVIGKRVEGGGYVPRRIGFFRRAVKPVWRAAWWWRPTAVRAVRARSSRPRAPWAVQSTWHAGARCPSAADDAVWRHQTSPRSTTDDSTAPLSPYDDSPTTCPSQQTGVIATGSTLESPHSGSHRPL